MSAERPISLRRTTLLLVALTTLALVVALYVPLCVLLLDSFRRLEAQSALRDVERAERAIQTDVDELAARCRDYATWDDTYAYLLGRAPDYAQVNYVDATFREDRLGLVAVVARGGEVRFEKGFDLNRHRPRALPDFSHAYRAACPAGRCSERAGIVETPDGPWLLAAHPVLTSSRGGPSPGALIMGRPLDRAEIARLGRSVHMRLSIERDTIRTRRLVRPLDDERVAAYAQLREINGAPYLVARVVLRRDIYESGRFGALLLAITLAIAGLVFGLVVLLLLDRAVLRRVARLSDDVRRVSASADPGLRVAVQGRDELAALAASINGMLGELATARQVIRAAFGRYVSEEVARTILAHPEAEQLGGQTREVTILFSDIRSYASISEHMAPSDVVDVLNEYFGAMSEVIEAEGGCVIEFFGDAILAVFGAPGELVDHPEHATRAALGMAERLHALNGKWGASGKAGFWQARGIDELGMRIGLHTGSVVVGNLGSPTRMKYALIGDTVNTAARIEALNDEVGTDILLTSEVRAQLGAELTARTEDRGRHAVKGRERSVHVYSIA